MRRRGYTDVSLSDTQLLANFDMDGTIISALARRAGISRQAVSQQTAALERAGYVERRASRTDGRSAVVHRTGRGRALLDDALDIVEELEAEYAGYLGPVRLNTLKRLLVSLLDHIDPEGVLGRE